MGYLIDSNVWISAASTKSPAREMLTKALKSEWAGYSSISRLEVLADPSISEEEKQALKEMMALFVEVPVDHKIIDKAIHVSQSTKIKYTDAIAAATAINMQAILVSRNIEDFSTVPALLVINPFPE